MECFNAVVAYSNLLKFQSIFGVGRHFENGNLKKHHVILRVKCKVLNGLENGKQSRDVAEQFGVPSSAFATWKKNKEENFSVH